MKHLKVKTHVAPLKPIKIARLNLCAAVIQAYLKQGVGDALNIKSD